MLSPYRMNKIDRSIEENLKWLKKWGLWVVTITLLFLILWLVYSIGSWSATHTLHFRSPILLQSPVLVESFRIVPKKSIILPNKAPEPKKRSELPFQPKILSPLPKEEPQITPSPPPQQGVWIGKVSHYSRAGCIGCSSQLLMANGQPLDDNALTIAFNWLPMNTQVKVTNLDNGRSVTATVTDTGGFNALNRIADLTLAVVGALGTKTDVTNVEVRAL